MQESHQKSIKHQKMIANPIRWPNGARVACCLTFDMDADSLIHLDHPTDGYKRTSAISMLQYGPHIAIPRILETYKLLGIKQTFFIPAWCIEQYPETIEQILAGGHEIGQHGYLHENPVGQPRCEQAAWMDKSLQVIKKMTGQSPRGFRAPLYNFSNHTAELLADRGFTYDASLMGDDIPYIIQSKAGKLVEIPSHWGLDDWPQYVQSMDLNYMMPIRSPQHGWQIFVEEFEAAYTHGGLWIPVIHPFATGRLSRWQVVATFIESVLSHRDVWFAPMEHIARHVQQVVDNATYTPRVVNMPQYQHPIKVTC